jgi:FAD/FMN-containing dehydrogenase
MGLEWVRLDSNIATHDKILMLLSDPAPEAVRFRAATSYMFALGYCGGHGTDGVIVSAALAAVHGTAKSAALLVKYRLWEPIENGWVIPNYAERQELTIVTAAKEAAKKAGGIKGACIRYHGKDCGCWRTQVGHLMGTQLGDLSR